MKRDMFCFPFYCNGRVFSGSSGFSARGAWVSGAEASGCVQCGPLGAGPEASVPAPKPPPPSLLLLLHVPQRTVRISSTVSCARFPRMSLTSSNSRGTGHEIEVAYYDPGGRACHCLLLRVPATHAPQGGRRSGP